MPMGAIVKNYLKSLIALAAGLATTLAVVARHRDPQV
jgi:hypothetical protein